ncbi:MAG TPA: HAD-IA family hydrolase [Bryobacteraceae bacterium]|nr:HAD-IA family hydrolase [Bryobacteraceae bacterium]
MAQLFPYYLFDVDGTLTDSALDITSSVQEVLNRNGHPAQPFPFLRSYIGRHLCDLFQDVIPGIDPSGVNDLIEQYRQIYAARGHANTRAYDGVLETLAVLPGQKATATTKGTPTTRIVLEQFGLLPYFHHVQGTDGFPAKPAPDVIQRSLEALGARPEEVLFVGDSAADMAAGRAAGVKVCAVRYGYGDHAEMQTYAPDFWIEHPSQLLSL